MHGLAVQAAEGMAEWLHSEVRRGLEIELDQGRRYSWGYPACPEQSEHEKVWRLLGLEEIGMTLSGGHAVMPEQSTVAIVAHHPQAVYFGMKSGFIPKEKAPDELIAGTDRGGELPPADEPREGAVEEEADALGDRRRLTPQLTPAEPQHPDAACFQLRSASPIALERGARPVPFPAVELDDDVVLRPVGVHLDAVQDDVEAG